MSRPALPVSPAPEEETSELTWYSRLAVLAGSLILVIQAVTGHGASVLTVVAVLAVSCGLVAFIAGLAGDGRRMAVGHADVQRGPVEEREVVATAPVVVEQRVARDETPDQDVTDVEPVRTPDGPVRTYRVADEAASQHCPACALQLGTGQIAAVCNVCSTSHHASCWIDRDFQCALPDCTGTGSLEPPGRSTLHSSVPGGA